MKIFFDTEFIEDGRTIDLISIGLVREDGETFYAECEECDISRASEWVKNNVLPHLKGGSFRMKRKDIANRIIAFVEDKPQFWAYFADYDWVALCQLYGTMMDLPKGWPMWCRDIKQLCVDGGNPSLPIPEAEEHNALLDAIWNAECWRFLMARLR